MLQNRRVLADLRIALVILAAAVATTCLYSFTAHAAAANTLKVTPVRTDVEVKPGERKVVKTTITNLTTSPITVAPVQNDFIAGDERGTPALILDADKFAENHSLKRFMAPLANVTVPGRQSKTIDVVLNVPKDAKAGGYFGAVRFAPATPDSGGQVNLNPSVASLILLRVPGPVEESVSLNDFQIKQGGKPGGFFNSSDNLQVSFRFKNEGNVQIGPIGKISVTKGDKVVFDTDFNNKTPRDVILPDSSRRWDVGLKDLGNFGHYTTTATFTYGDENKTIEVTKSFWVVPLPYIIAAVAGLVVLIGLVVGVWFFLRSYKKRILRNSNNGGRRRTRR